MSTTNLECCCCGGDAGRFEQHWNRDTGYGICARCVAEEMGRPASAERLEELYGKPDVNYRRPMIIHMGRRFRAMAVFPNSEQGARAANAFMERNEGAAVLCVTDAVYLAHTDDKGEPIATEKPRMSTTYDRAQATRNLLYKLKLLGFCILDIQVRASPTLEISAQGIKPVLAEPAHVAALWAAKDGGGYFRIIIAEAGSVFVEEMRDGPMVSSLRAGNLEDVLNNSEPTTTK